MELKKLATCLVDQNFNSLTSNCNRSAMSWVKLIYKKYSNVINNNKLFKGLFDVT